jgi:heme-degrading monooxygenase HmoA
MAYTEPAAEDSGLLYEDSVGEMNISEGFAVLNNIAVTEKSRPVFEDRFQKRARLIEQEPSFQAIRILRTLSDDTYVIITIGKNEESFKNWQKSKAL